MGLWSFLKNVMTNNDDEIEDIPQETEKNESHNSYYRIDFSDRNPASVDNQIKTTLGNNDDLEVAYVEVSTAADDRVCPMCAQFEGKIFPKDKAPKLPLCPSCSCDFLYYFKSDLPANAIINDVSNFVLPAECVTLFYKHRQKLYEEKDIYKQIRICESDMKNLSEFMKPYTEAGFPPPPELACRDILPDLYMRLGKWKKAEITIEKCIEFGAYNSADGSEALEEYKLFKEVATETLAYIEQNPGCLQRNMYKIMSYEDEKKEILKYFLKYSEQIKKIKHGNTNELYINTPEGR